MPSCRNQRQAHGVWHLVIHGMWRARHTPYTIATMLAPQYPLAVDHNLMLYWSAVEPVVDLKALARQVQKLWHPTRIARLNDYEFKLARMHGDFVWHSHEDTDEAFMVVEGELRIDFRDGSVRLKPGQLYVVPRGVEHKPFAGAECTVLLIEPLGTLNTGNVITDKTVYQPDRLS